MIAQPEVYKGIEYVRISSLPGDLREKIWRSFQHDKIIKIVKDQALLNDCILYHDFMRWLSEHPDNPIQASACPPQSNRSSFERVYYK